MMCKECKDGLKLVRGINQYKCKYCADEETTSYVDSNGNYVGESCEDCSIDGNECQYCGKPIVTESSDEFTKNLLKVANLFKYEADDNNHGIYYSDIIELLEKYNIHESEDGDMFVWEGK